MRSLVPYAAALAMAASPITLAPAMAQDTAPAAGHHQMMIEGTTLTVSAESRTSERPDIATVTAGVVTEAPTAEAALAENARRMTAVIAAIKRAGVADRDIQTSQLSIQPQTVYAENVPPRVTGYQATNTVSVKVRNLANVGKTVDALVQQGGNQLNGIQFGLNEPDAALDRARAEALKKARARADVYAQAVGMRVHKIIAIQEGGSVDLPRPMPQMAMRMAANESTPVQAGEVDLTANVTVMFELR
ncbi:MAG: SIMPL domain-containing protein [Alphaproteobacteria bacterium]|nr:SIMPL domain-containing protein [Alphaproteobacteria bacterium]